MPPKFAQKPNGNPSHKSSHRRNIRDPEVAEVLQLLNNPRVLQKVAANSNKFSEIHNLLDNISSQWKVMINQQIIDPNPARMSSLSIQKPSEACVEISGWKVEQSVYDEMYDSSNNLRPAYQDIIPVIQQIEQEIPNRIDSYVDISYHDFQKDNRQYHIPRMLTIAEHQTIHQGVLQRAKAFQMFLEDFYTNQLNCRCVRENVIPVEILRQIISRNTEDNIYDDCKYLSQRWSFWYGPDLLRGSDGEFYVCEDNIGYVGGMGDLVCSRKSLLRTFPEYSACIGGSDPSKFYDSIADHYKSQVNPGECVVLLHYPKNMTADNEERRVIRLLKQRGIFSVVLPCADTKRKKRFNNKDTLRCLGNRVELTRFKRKTQQTIKMKVGLIIIDAEPFDIDPRNSSIRKKAILDEAQYWLESLEEKLARLSSKPPKSSVLVRINYVTRKRDELQKLIQSDHPRKYQQIAKYLRQNHREEFRDLLKQGVKGLMKCYFNGHVKLVNGPGYDFLGDKMICMFSSSLIQLYLGEQPILREIPTFSFADKQGNLDQGLVSMIFSDPQTQPYVVIKRVDGRGGNAVWVGAKISPNEFQQARPLVENEPGAFIVQKYLALSELDGHLVDLRNLAIVDSKSIIVSETLWGRGVPTDGNGKVNISDKGFEFAICTATR